MGNKYSRGKALLAAKACQEEQVRVLSVTCTKERVGAGSRHTGPGRADEEFSKQLRAFVPWQGLHQGRKNE